MITNAEIEQRRDNSVARAIAYSSTFVAARAQGGEVWDVEGNRFIDFCGGIGCQNVGHGHPKVIAAIERQINSFTHTCFQICPYESYVRLAERLNALVKIDTSVPFEQAALFGCAVVTGVGSVVNTAGVRPGQSMAIIGLGGVGLSAMLAAIASGAGRVIAVDINDDKLQLALQLGAHEAFNAKDGDCVERVRAATRGGVHIAIETAGVPQALDLAYKVTRRGGTTVAAGMPGPDASITLSHLSLAGEERTLKGSYMGSCVPSRDIPRYIGLFLDGKLPIDRLTSHHITIDELNEGFDRMADGSILRQVLVL